MNTNNMKKLSLVMIMGVAHSAVYAGELVTLAPNATIDMSGVVEKIDNFIAEQTEAVLVAIKGVPEQVVYLLNASTRASVVPVVQESFISSLSSKAATLKNAAIAQAQAAYVVTKNAVMAVPHAAKEGVSVVANTAKNGVKAAGNGIAKAGNAVKNALVGAAQKTAGGVQYVVVNSEQKLISVYDATLTKLFAAGSSLKDMNGHLKAAIVVTTAAVVIGGTVWMVKSYLVRKQAEVEREQAPCAPCIVSVSGADFVEVSLNNQ